MIFGFFISGRCKTEIFHFWGYYRNMDVDTFLAMMYPFLSGMAFLGGTVFLMIAVGIYRLRFKWTKVMGILWGLLALMVIVVSAEPLLFRVYSIWGIALAGVVIGSITKKRQLSNWSHVVFNVITLVILMQAINKQQLPVVFQGDYDEIYLIGDSVSAGIGGRDEIIWPAIFEQETGCRVINAAVAGATAESALEQVDQIKEGGKKLVIVEIGGNDLLGQATPSDYYDNLERLIEAIRKKTDGPVVMLELPLLPFKNQFGMAQRQIARKYSINLAPRRYFAKVLCTPGATRDGAHLTPEGHQLMAQMMQQIVSKYFNPAD